MNSPSVSFLQSSLQRGGSCLLLAFGLAVASHPLLAAPADDQPDQKPKPGQQMRQMAEILGLSEAQKTQIREIMEGQRAKMEALRDDESTPRAEKRGKMRAMREEIRQSIRAVLTPEQQAKFDAMPRPEPGQRRPEGGSRPKRD